MTDRSAKPSIHQIPMPHVAELKCQTLDNGVPMYLYTGGIQPIVKINFIVRASGLFCSKAGVAGITANMLIEGIEGMGAEELQEKFEFYGASFTCTLPTNNHVAFSLFALDKHLDKLIPLAERILKTPSFPERELGIMIEKKMQEYRIRMQKPRNIARDTFRRNFYAEGNIYGREMGEKEYRAITRQDLVDFHRATYNAANTQIYVAGNPSENTIELIRKHFGTRWGDSGSIVPIPEQKMREWANPIIEVDRPNSTQACIRMGAALPKFSTDDYHKLTVANAIFGGYFGSRLMQNIREKKGLTYGINSMLSTSVNGNKMIIASEVEPSNWKLVIDEVLSEMNTMRNTPVGQEEIDNVRGYLKGQILSAYESTLGSVEAMASLILEEMPVDMDRRMYQMLDTITAADIQEVAQRYMIPENFKTVVVK